MKKLFSLSLALLMLICMFASCDQMPKGDVYIPDKLDGEWSTMIAASRILDIASGNTSASELFAAMGFEGYLSYTFTFADDAMTFGCDMATFDIFVTEFTNSFSDYMLTEEGFEAVFSLPQSSIPEEYDGDVLRFLDENGADYDTLYAEFYSTYQKLVLSLSMTGFFKYENPIIYLADTKADLDDESSRECLVINIKEQAFYIEEVSSLSAKELFTGLSFAKY